MAGYDYDWTSPYTWATPPSTSDPLAIIGGTTTPGTGTLPGTVAAANVPVPTPRPADADIGPWGNGWGGGAGTGKFPPAPGSTGGGSDSDGGFGWNSSTLNLAMSGLNTIGNLWQVWEQRKAEKEKLKFQKEVFNANYANQVMAYNTALEDRINNRMESGGWDSKRGSDFIASHRLDRTAIV